MSSMNEKKTEEINENNDKINRNKIISSMKKSLINVESKKKCFIGQGNNSSLIENILLSNGFERVEEIHDGIQLIWIQIFDHQINWNSFRENAQCLNHIQGEDFFTSKLQLYLSLKTYEKCLNKSPMFSRSSFYLPLDKYYPQTFNFEDKFDRDQLFSIHQNGNIWISKPSEMNRGSGIRIIRHLDDLQKEFSSEFNSNSNSNSNEKNYLSKSSSMKRIIQRYITNPLLIRGKKFDIRCYMLISNVHPLIVFYHDGYLRLSILDFNPSDPNILIHLTNQCIQKKDPQYKEKKEETCWTMKQFNDYLNEEIRKKNIRNIEENWVNDILPKKIIQILLNVIESIRMRLKRRIGCFGLYGCDFIIDDQFNVFLLEINLNPSLSTNTKTLSEIIPSVVRQSIQISFQCFEKIRHDEYLFPLKSIETFQLIYNEYEQKSSKFHLNPQQCRYSSSMIKSSNEKFFSSHRSTNVSLQSNECHLPSIHRFNPSEHRQSIHRSSYGKRTKHGETFLDDIHRNRNQRSSRSTSASTNHFSSSSSSSSLTKTTNRSKSFSDLIRSTLKMKFPSLISTIEE